MQSEVKFPARSPISEDCKAFLTELLTKDPIKRLNFEGIKNHPWMAGIDWQKAENKMLDPPIKP